MRQRLDVGVQKGIRSFSGHAVQWTCSNRACRSHLRPSQRVDPRQLPSSASLAPSAMSGSAVLPPKRPSRSPLKLQLPGADTPPAAPSRPAPPKLSLAPASPAPPPERPAPAPPGRPALKLASVTDGVASLSLAIPTQGPSHYSSALNGPSESDSEFDEDDEASAHRPWAAGEQERMAGELLNVINGPPLELEDELSGRTRRARSNSRIASRRPSFSNDANSAQAKGATHLSPPLPPNEAGGSPGLGPRLGLYGEHVQAALGVGGGATHRASPLSSPAPPSTGSAQSGYESGVSGTEDEEEEEEDALDISPATLEDLGRLGEGASGEVRKVLHKPTGIVMARKVRSRAALRLPVCRLTGEPADHYNLAEPEAAQAASSRAAFHARLHAPEHRAVLRRVSRGGESRPLACQRLRLICPPAEQHSNRHLHGVL